MTWRDLKAEMRRDLHAEMALPCAYLAPGTGGPGPGPEPVDITARFHDKNRTGGDLNGQGWATVQEGVTRIIFNREELVVATVVPVQYATVTFSDFFAEGSDLAVRLMVREPYDGPIEERWTVAPA